LKRQTFKLVILEYFYRGSIVVSRSLLKAYWDDEIKKLHLQVAWVYVFLFS